MRIAFTQIINDCIPTKFTEPGMKDLCIEILNNIANNMQFFSFNSVYNLYLETLYEISLTLSDTDSNTVCSISNTLDTIIPSRNNIVDLSNVEDSERFSVFDTDFESYNYKPSVNPIFFDLITKGAFLCTGVLLGVCIGPKFLSMTVLALYL